MEVRVNKEIREYAENMFFGLTLRQFFFSVLGCAAAVGEEREVDIDDKDIKNNKQERKGKVQDSKDSAGSDSNSGSLYRWDFPDSAWKIQQDLQVRRCELCSCITCRQRVYVHEVQ